MKDIIVIVGPTGVGKTKLSIELAKKLDAEVINADSVSIYKRLNIGSAKPTIEERKEVGHHMIDVCDINEEYSIYEYQKEVRKLIDEISPTKRIIMVGGTGLYIKAALYDYKFKENDIYDEYNELTNDELYLKIKEYDKDIEIDKNNRRRLVRYLNKLMNSEEIPKTKDSLLYNAIFIGLTTERDILYKRINDRVDMMFNNGLLDEVSSLKKYYKTSRILNNAIGYKEFYDYFYNDKCLEEVVDEIKKDSRHYAKRQYTFFNNQLDVKWFETDFLDFSKTISDVYNYINRNDVK